MKRNLILTLVTSLIALVYAQSIQERASRGAITEGIFILKNKQNALAEYKHTLEHTLKKAPVKHSLYNQERERILKELNTKQAQLAHAPHKPQQRFIKKKIDTLEHTLTRLLLDQAHLIMKESIYPDFIKEITDFSTLIEQSIALFLEEEISEKDIHKRVFIADVLVDKIMLQMDIVRLFVELSTDLLKLAEKKSSLARYEEEYQHLKEKLTSNQQVAKIKQLLAHVQRSIVFLKNSYAYRQKCFKQKEKHVAAYCKELAELLFAHSFDKTAVSPDWFIKALQQLDNKVDTIAMKADLA